MLFFLLALFVLFVSNLPWVALFQTRNKPAWLMAFYLVGSANIVLVLMIANGFHLLNRQWFVLALHILIGAGGWLIWFRRGGPALLGPFRDWRPKFDVQWLRRDPLLILLALLITLSYIFALVQLIHIPQNNMDSLSTHLSRIVFWRQHGSLLPWSTTMLNQVWYPVNAQLQTYWTLLFLSGDQLVGGVQWLAAMVSALGVFGMARLYGYETRQSAFAALVFLSFPLIALQSTTTQTDLVTMVFFIAAVYFLMLGLRDGQNPLLFLSAISTGLGVGVKKSYFLLFPILAVVALLVCLQNKRLDLRRLVVWSLSLVVSIGVLGAYTYIVNWRYFGDPFGSPAYFDSLIETPQDQGSANGVTSIPVSNGRNNLALPSGPVLDSSSDGGIFMELVYNIPRLIYQSIDTSGLPRPLDGYAHKVKMRLARPFFQWIGFEEIEGAAYTAPGHQFSFSDKNINEENNAWYGPLSVLLLFPAILIEAWRGIRQRSYLPLIPGVALLIFLPMEVILRPGWDPFQGRYFAPLVALGAPLMAIWFRKNRNAVYQWLIGGSAVVFIAVTLLYNPSKPTLGKFADEFHVWSNDRIFIQRKNDRDVYYMVEEFAPAESTLGYYVPFFILDYPLFGENLTRRLVPMVSPAQISDLQWLRDHEVDYLLLPKKDEFPIPPSEYQIIGRVPGWRLYIYQPTP